MAAHPQPAPTGPGDVVGFYASIGVELPTWGAGRNASVRCFANPDAHEHDDRTKSMSVLLSTGAFNCHACGAHGSVWDAALAVGLTPGEAMERLVRYGLRSENRNRTSPRRGGPRPVATRAVRPAPEPVPFTVTEAHVADWARQLARRPQLIERLEAGRGWSPSQIHALGLGIDRGRITLPIRDAAGGLVGLKRYRPFDRGNHPKMVGVVGGRNDLFPRPELLDPERAVLLCEGEPDAIAALSYGVPATGIPGDQSWRSSWARRFDGRVVVVAMDADKAGRRVASRIAFDLSEFAQSVLILDPDRGRSDGYDVTDLLLEGGPDRLTEALLGARRVNYHFDLGRGL